MNTNAYFTVSTNVHDF